MYELTENQLWVIEELKRQDCPMLAAQTEEHWSNGQEHYIDSRVKVKGIRRKFNQGNKEAITFPPNPVSVVIIARRWFDRANGNTYFSATGIADGEVKARIDFAYGYGDHCIDETAKLLHAARVVKLDRHANGSWEPLWRYCQDHKIRYYADITDVSRKKDL